MYLDPAFGGMLLQVIIVIAAVGGALIFSLRKKIKDFFAGIRNKGKGDETAGDQNISVSGKFNREDDVIDTLADSAEDNLEK